MRTLLALLFIFSFLYAPLSYSMLDEESSETVLTQNDLDEVVEKGVSINNKKIVLSGSFEEEDLWKDLEKKIPNVKDLSLKYVNQPSFRTEENRQAFLKSLCSLNNLEKLSLENQFFTDEHLNMIPKQVKVLDLSRTSVLGYGLKYLSKNVQVIGIKDSRTSNIHGLNIDEELILSPIYIMKTLQTLNGEKDKIIFLQNTEQKFFIMGQIRVYKDKLNFKNEEIVNELSKIYPKELILLILSKEQ